MAKKTKAMKAKTKTPSSSIDFYRIRFKSQENRDNFESLTKYRSIWGERKLNLDELDPKICRNFKSRNWLSICEVSDPPPTTLIREFYSNLSTPMIPIYTM